MTEMTTLGGKPSQCAEKPHRTGPFVKVLRHFGNQKYELLSRLQLASRDDMTTSMDIITTTEALDAFCKRLSSEEFITVDTEFHRETTYWPLLCLIQVAGPDEAHCIDSLADGIDLSPLYDLFRDPKIVKVFHAARQDLEIFFHKADLIPAPLFDTQVAAMVCGFGESVGYETLVTKLTSAKIDKSQRFTDWTRRPLSEKQIQYALADVVHLRDVYDKLKSELERSDRAPWVAEEMGILTSPKTYDLSPEESWRRLKSREKKPRYLAILKEVSAWRERTAQKQDTPRRRVIKDDALIELAALKPTNEKALSQTRLSKHFARSKHAADIFAAITRGIETPDDLCPKTPKAFDKPPGLGPVIDLLKVLLKARCEGSDVALKLVATVDDLEKIACDDNADVPALSGWRRDLFGADAIRLKHGQLALGLSPDSKTVDVMERPQD